MIDLVRTTEIQLGNHSGEQKSCANTCQPGDSHQLGADLRTHQERIVKWVADGQISVEAIMASSHKEHKEAKLCHPYRWGRRWLGLGRTG